MTQTFKITGIQWVAPIEAAPKPTFSEMTVEVDFDPHVNETVLDDIRLAIEEKTGWEAEGYTYEEVAPAPEPIILNDLTEQKARIDEQHKALAALMKRFPSHYRANKEDYIIMASNLCAATMMNDLGEYDLAEEFFKKAEESIGFLDYKLNDAATDIDF